MAVTTLGKAWVRQSLPKNFAYDDSQLTGDSFNTLLVELAKGDPDQYKKITKQLSDIGSESVYYNGTTLKLSNLTSPINRISLYKEIKAKERQIDASGKMSDKEKKVAKEYLYSKMQKLIEETTYSSALKANNPLAVQVASKARANLTQLAAMLSTPSIYTDAQNNYIPLFIKHSYAEGLTPAEYWASTYGARKGVISTKFSTMEGGDFGKQLISASDDLSVTESDCGTFNGLPVAIDDNDNVGSLLARDYPGFKTNMPITKGMLATLKKKGYDEIIVRSPVTCDAKRGLCKHCAGLREDGKLPEMLDHIGIKAASPISERIAQGALNQKHCLIIDTKILMSNFRNKCIQDVEIGDMVWGSDLKGNIRPVKVLNVFNNGIRPCVNTKFRLGMSKQHIELGSTIDHEILGMRHVTSQKEAILNNIPRKLKVGIKSRTFNGVCINSVDCSSLGLKTDPMAFLLGLLLGDGCYTQSVNAVHFSCADTLLIEQLVPILHALNLKLRKCKGHSYYYALASYAGSNNGHNTIKQYLLDNNLYNKKSYEKCIPNYVNTWNKESVANLIAGLVITDGSVYRNSKDNTVGIAFCSTSKAMVEKLKELLHYRFGIHSTAVTKVANAGTVGPNNFKNNHDRWQITITNKDSIHKFSENIPLLGIKQLKLRTYIDEQLFFRGNHDYYRAFRISRESIGEQPTYDIEVDHPDHLFVLANGLIVGNSSGQQSGERKTYSGFNIIDQFTKIPKTFTSGATVSTLDGDIENIEDAPQGGKYITIKGEQHYVSPEMDITVKKGDKVEAGDAISDGLINPYDVVKYKGIGEGRRYFTNRFMQLLKDSKISANRRNVEVVSRALINNVLVNGEGIGNTLPGDIATYSSVAKDYTPREGSKTVATKSAYNKYLEQPALHYTIGTRVTKSVADALQKHNYNNILTNDNKPDFEPEMKGLRFVPHYGEDWQSKLRSSYIKGNLIEDVQRGADSQEHSENPIPALLNINEFRKTTDKRNIAY